MSVWDTYTHRIEAIGGTRRGETLSLAKRRFLETLPDNLSYTSVTIYDREHGFNINAEGADEFAVTKDAVVINSDNLNQKFILSLPEDDIGHGDLVYWMDNYWLVTERDPNTTLYTKAKMEQCNHLLKWVSKEDVICEQWCIVEDGTKYLTGEYEDSKYIITRGDSRIALTIARNNETARLTRSNRFLIDDELASPKLAYALTKPFKVQSSFGGSGVFKFVMQEVNTTDDDWQEGGIADYYKHFPKNASPGGSNTPGANTGSSGRTVWL